MNAKPIRALACWLVGGGLSFPLIAQQGTPQPAVTLPYGEFRQLLEQAGREERRTAEPPVGAFVAAAKYRIDDPDGEIGSVEFEVVHLAEGWQAVPLAGPMVVLGSEPAEAPLVVREGALQFLSEGRGRKRVTVRFRLASDPNLERDGRSPWRLALAAATRQTLEIGGVPPDGRVRVDGRVATGPLITLPASGGLAEIAIETPEETSDARWSVRVEIPEGSVEVAECETSLVGDGSLLCRAAYQVDHRGAIGWRLRLPSGAILQRCEVAGLPVRPLKREGEELEILLPAPAGGKPTRVQIEYTGRADRFAPVSGRLSVELPRTPWLVRRTSWLLALPAAFEITALEGNVETGPPEEDPSRVRLMKALCREEAPEVELHYRKKMEDGK